MTARPFLLDVNVLVALSWPQHVHHARSHDWFDRLEQPWATTPITESGYVRLSCNPAVVGVPLSMTAALAALRALRAAPGHIFIDDRSTLAEPVIGLERLATSRQVTDAHLVNVAASAGAVLATLDHGIEQLVLPADRDHVFVLPA